MKSVFYLLLLIGLALAQRPQGQKGGSCDEPDSLVDQLLEYASGDEESDSSELDDIEVPFAYPGVRGKLSLSKGQMSGIMKQAQRKGSSESEKLEEGNKCLITAGLRYGKLQVEYNDVDIQTKPDVGVDADSYQGYLSGVEAYLVLQYDEDQDQMKMKWYGAGEAKQASFTLKGAEKEQRENPMIENEVQYQLQKATAKAMRQQMKDAVEGYNSQDPSK